jgi:hypothetical protein
MAATMTNRLLSLVMALACISAVAAHAASNGLPRLSGIAVGFRVAPPHIQPLSLPTAGLQAAAAEVTARADAVIDPHSAITAAYQRDHVALEHLRQQASALKGAAHPAFNRLIDSDEATLATLERQALDYSSGNASANVALMDQLVTSAQQSLNAALAGSQALKTSHGHKP